MNRAIIFALLIAGRLFGAVSSQFSQFPIALEPNQGQFAPEVQFGSSGAAGLKLGVTQNGIKIQTGDSANSETLWMRWKNGIADPAITGEAPLPGRSNYLIGADAAQWKTGIPSYRQVRIQQIYRGIDLVLYGNKDELEYDLVLAPGADVKSIALEFIGTAHLRKSSQGDLEAKCGSIVLRQHRPRIYQERNGRRVPIRGEYTLIDSHTVGFKLAPYQRTEPLVIDPVLSFSAVFGGSGTDTARHVTVDASGNVYVVGSTTSLDFPLTNAYQAVPPGQNSVGNPAHIFVTKLDPTGSTILFSTYLGGSAGESGRKIAVSASGNVYIAGSTVSFDFPTTGSGFGGGSLGNGLDDITLTVLSSSGSSLVYSVLIGGIGDDEVQGLAVDTAGNCFLAGSTDSPDFPITAQAHNDLAKLNSSFSTAKAFVLKVNPSGTGLLYSAVVGGSGVDLANGLAVDNQGAAYIAGTTTSFDFPVTPGVYQSTGNIAGSNTKGFITKISPDGSLLQFSTYLGGSVADQINDIKLDNVGSIYVTGLTTSPDFPHPQSSFYSPYSGSNNAVFVSKLNAIASSLLYSAIFGGSNNSLGSLAVNANSEAIVTGSTDFGFPVKAGAIQIYQGYGSAASQFATRMSAFIIKLNSNGTDSVFSTYLGGGNTRSAAVTVDTTGAAILTGTADPTFPVTAGAYQSINKGQVFIARISDSPCTYTVQAITVMSASVTTQNDCKWIAVSGSPWLGVTLNTASGSGNGIVQLIASQNTGAARSGIVSIAGSLFTVNQAGGCQFRLSSTSQDFSAIGGTGQFSIFTSSGCALPTATTSASWIHITSGAGSSSYTYSVDRLAAVGQVRAGTITAGSSTLTIFQSSCTYSLSLNQNGFNAAGGSGTIQITTQSGCGWTAISNTPSWITLNTSGAGSSAPLFTVQQNTSGTLRIGLLTVAGSTFSVSQTAYSFNSRNKTYPAVWRPANGTWYLSQTWNSASATIKQWGLPGDVPVPGEYDGDGKNDFAVWRPANGTWYILPSSSPNNSGIYQWGLSGDIPVPGDYDGGGQTDLAVWRPSNGTWYVQSTSSSTRISQQWGLTGDVPVPGDYDGDGKTDFAVWRPANGTWYIIPSSRPSNLIIQQWGLSGDVVLKKTPQSY